MSEPAKSVPASALERDAQSHGFCGPVGVFQKLIAQHEELAKLLTRAKNAVTAESRRELWTEIRGRLLSHERAEDLELHSALEGRDAARDILEDHAREEQELELAICELQLVEYTSPDWTAHLLEVASLFEEHARSEEEELYPFAQQLLGEATAREMEEHYAAAQRTIRGNMA